MASRSNWTYLLSPLSRNQDVLTIESELERSLFDSGLIAPYNYGDLKKSAWQRAARTDKGVHAIANVVNCKIQIKNELIEDKEPEPSSKKETEPASKGDEEEKGEPEPVDKLESDDEDDKGKKKGGPQIKRCLEFKKVVEIINKHLPPEIRIFCKPFTSSYVLNEGRHQKCVKIFQLQDICEKSRV